MLQLRHMPQAIGDGRHASHGVVAEVDPTCLRARDASYATLLVTSHDAYNYFGRAYGFQVVGLQGISTVTEAGLADMAKLSDFIRQKRIRAVFVESSVPHQTIERISKDTGVKIGGELFSDAMGTPGQIENGYDLGTYEGMIKHNLNTIVEGLK